MRINVQRGWQVMGLGALCLTASMVQGCTGMKIRAADGAVIHGRTLEFGADLHPSLAVVPRAYAFVGKTGLGKGLAYQAKYAAVGAMLFEERLLVDGVNEKGLAIGTFYFPGYARYAEATPEIQSRSLSPMDFPNWVLTQFSTLDEVRSALERVFVVETPLTDWENKSPPFHYIVYDAQGSALVIEPLEGKLVTYENQIGVFTNSPRFDWHMTNLNNYLNLKANNISPIQMEGMTLTPPGQGSGLVGLPGDFTPPSRFVRAALFARTAIPSATGEQAVFQLFHLLNQFDLPYGAIRDESGSSLHAEITSFTCVRDPQALKYYFKSYEDQTLRVVDLNAFDLDAKEIMRGAASGVQQAVGFSGQLKALPPT